MHSLMSGSGPGPPAPAVPPERGKPRRILAAIAITVLVVAAGVVSYEVYQATRPTTTYPPPPAGWTTLDGAWTAVSNAFSALANGSWSISFAEGVAADGHWSPPAALFMNTGGKWSNCEAQLSGISTLTYWNASQYPSTQSATVFTSGGAPLWTFVFNGTDTWTYVASWFLGTVILNAALGPGSSCLQFGVFNSPAYQRVSPSQELNSNAIATEVRAEDDYLAGIGYPMPPTPMPVPPNPGVALYLPGPQVLPYLIVGQSQWTLAYTTCGLNGYYGTTTPFTAYLLNSTAPPSGHNYQWGIGPGPCYDAVYSVDLNRTVVVGAPSGRGQYFEWRTNVSFLTSAVPTHWSLSDFSTSLFGLELNSLSPSPGSLPSSAALCGPGSHNLSSCPAPSAGWYAVLLSPTGVWLDSFPSSPNGTQWALPNVLAQSRDLLAFVGSGAYTSTDSLSISSAIEPHVFGGDYLVGP